MELEILDDWRKSHQTLHENGEDPPKALAVDVYTIKPLVTLKCLMTAIVKSVVA